MHPLPGSVRHPQQVVAAVVVPDPDPVAAAQHAAQLPPEPDRVLQGGSLAFDASTFEIWGPLLNGATVVFPPAQAILAAKAGASFISPFLGRLDDIGENGLGLLQDIIEIYHNYSWKTEVLAASLRHPIHVIEAARMGADIATMPFKVIDQLFNHPLTDKGQAQFLADWAKSGRK